MMNNFALLLVFNILFNCIAIFLLACLLIEGAIWIFRIEHPRLKYVARFVPLVKLVSDLFLYEFSTWAIFSGINPLLCEKNSRLLMLAAGIHTHPMPFFLNFSFALKGGKTFSIGDIVSLFLGENLTLALTLIFSFGSLISLMLLLFRYKKSASSQTKLLLNTTPYMKKLPLKLQQQILCKKIQIRTSSKINIPCAVKKYILLPKNLDKFTDQEVHTMIAHELEHILWKDAPFQIVIRGFQYFFWFVPLIGFWIKRMFQERELSCDKSIKKYALNPIDLGLAIKKCASQKCPSITELTFATRNLALRRIKEALCPALPRKLWKATALNLGFIFIVLLIFFGKLFIF